jgi:hypothetical protein
MEGSRGKMEEKERKRSRRYQVFEESKSGI